METDSRGTGRLSRHLDMEMSSSLLAAVRLIGILNI